MGVRMGMGGIECSFFSLSLSSQNQVPPTKNLDNLPGEGQGNEGNKGAYPFEYVRGEGQAREVEVALTNSFGFGGTNASLCVRKWRG